MRGPSPRRLIVAAWLVAAVAVVGVALLVNLGRPPGPVVTPVVGAPAPLFDLQTLDGGRVALADLRGAPVVVNFWASWCPTCRDEAPLLAAAAVEYGGRGVRLIGIVYQDSPDAARDFMRQYGLTFPGLIDPDGRTAIDYGVFGIPETFFIDAAGIVRSRQIGPLTAATLRDQVVALLR